MGNYSYELDTYNEHVIYVYQKPKVKLDLTAFEKRTLISPSEEKSFSLNSRYDRN